jgi:uncharacterized protein (DUF1501 family)
MNNVSRRRFLMQLGAAGAAGVSTPMWMEVIQKGGLPWAWGAGEGDVLPLGTPICVHISLLGGNDYLNTLVPVQDGFYRDATVGHGPIALTEAETLALTDSTYRLHNNLPWLADRWNNAGDVAFVLGVGNMTRNFSHFDSIKFWETGRLDVVGKTGWLGRLADVVRPGNALACVSIDDLRAEAIGATAPALVLSECANFAYQPGWLSPTTLIDGTKQMATISAPGAVGEIAKTMQTTFQVSGRIAGSDDPAVTGKNTGYSELGVLTKNLVQTAQLIKAGVPAQSYTIGRGGFDSHSDQKAMQIARYTELNDALTKFFSLLAGTPRQNDVFVLITSEFGRQVTANKDNGTDHGQAGMAVFIGGGAVRGVYGQAPTLDPGGPTRPNRIFDALTPTLDFRTVHATALARMAKGDSNVADSVLGGHYENLGVFTAQAPTTTTSSTVVATTTTVKPTTTTVKPTTTTVKPTTTTVKPTTTTVKPTTTTTAAVNKPPVASFTLSATLGFGTLTTTADGSASRDPDGSIASYRWAWGDGTADSTGVKVVHKFAKRGTFTVRLTVTDNRGAATSTTKQVKVY